MTPFQTLDQPTKQILTIDNKSYLFFGGTAYLGLLDNPEYISLYKEGIDRYGLNNGTSRSNNVQLGVYGEAEEKLACRFGFESAAVFSSGYLAAQAAVRALLEDKVIIYAPASHPALWIDGNPDVRGCFEDWVSRTILFINESSAKEFVIISNCIDNLLPANYDFSRFVEVKGDKKLLFLLDDSHGLGVVRKNAVSTDLSSLKLQDNFEILIVSSLAKGLGTDAGLILGTKNSLDKVRRHPIFLGASPCAPAAMYALINGDSIYDQAFRKLHSNISYFRESVQLMDGLNCIDNFPVFTSVDDSLYAYLIQNNILVSSFPYPLPTSPLLNRIVISALHEKDDLDCLIEIYNSKSK